MVRRAPGGSSRRGRGGPRPLTTESPAVESERRAGLVSIVVPVFNRPRFLVEAVESALVQTYRELEVVVVDDASTDETPQAVASLVARGGGRVRALRSDANVGPGGSRELGRRHARGEFVQYLDSDDLLLPHKLDLQVAALRRKTEAGIAYGWTRMHRFDGTLEDRPYKRTAEAVDAVFPAFLAGRVWNTVTPLYRASVTDALGPWSDLRLEEDWEYDCRAGTLGVRLAHVEDWVCDFRDHSGPRLGPGAPLEPRRLREQARAHEMIHGHAVAAGVLPEVAEMAHFARALFLLARRCGAAGLHGEARSLFRLARAASAPDRARGWDFRLIGLLAPILGWRLVGRMTIALDVIRDATSGGPPHAKQ